MEFFKSTGRKEGIELEMKVRKDWNLKFVNRFRREITTVVWPCKKNVSNVDIKDIRIKI